MNREIKFRAWDSELKFMVDPNSYIISFLGVPFFDNKGDVCEQSEKLKVMQYTRLKDKNGKEIYEDDICKDDDGRIYSVIGQPGYFSFAGGVMGCGDLEQSQMQIEVIGNIYENPEMLNSDTDVQECDATNDEQRTKS